MLPLRRASARFHRNARKSASTTRRQSPRLERPARMHSRQQPRHAAFGRDDPVLLEHLAPHPLRMQCRQRWVRRSRAPPSRSGLLAGRRRPASEWSYVPPHSTTQPGTTAGQWIVSPTSWSTITSSPAAASKMPMAICADRFANVHAHQRGQPCSTMQLHRLDDRRQLQRLEWMQLAVERDPLADDPFRACRLVHRYFLRVAFDERQFCRGSRSRTIAALVRIRIASNGRHHGHRCPFSRRGHAGTTSFCSGISPVDASRAPPPAGGPGLLRACRHRH